MHQLPVGAEVEAKVGGFFVQSHPKVKFIHFFDNSRFVGRLDGHLGLCSDAACHMSKKPGRVLVLVTASSVDGSHDAFLILVWSLEQSLWFHFWGNLQFCIFLYGK